MSADEPDLPIVDTHQHLWDLKRFQLDWQQSEELAPLRRSFLMADYIAATRGLHVVKSVYMEVDVRSSQEAAEAEYVIDLCQRDDNPMAAAVISGRPNEPEFEPYIRRFAKSPYIKGVRQVLHGASTPAGYCLQPQFVRGIRLLGELGLRFDLCMRPGEIVDGVKLVDQCPGTQFVVDHCGNMGVQSREQRLRTLWEEGMREMAQRKNVVCKISGLVASARKDGWTADDLVPNMNFSMDLFGEDRILFGGDWPVCTLTATYRQWVEALRQIVRDRPSAFQRKLFYDNAVRFYGLE